MCYFKNSIEGLSMRSLISIIILSFFFTGCFNPCKDEKSSINSLQSRLNSKQSQILNLKAQLNEERGQVAKLKSTVKERKQDINQLKDERINHSGEVSKAGDQTYFMSIILVLIFICLLALNNVYWIIRLKKTEAKNA